MRLFAWLQAFRAMLVSHEIAHCEPSWSQDGRPENNVGLETREMMVYRYTYNTPAVWCSTRTSVYVCWEGGCI